MIKVGNNPKEIWYTLISKWYTLYCHDDRRLEEAVGTNGIVAEMILQILL